MKTTLIRFLLAIALMLSATFSLSAHDFEAINDDGVTIYYNLLSDTECEVTGYNKTAIDSRYFSITIPATVFFNGNTLSVTAIGYKAFYKCESLTSITLPSSVTRIDFGAFYGCRRLASISLPNGLTSIGNEAFMNCTELASILIPSSVTEFYSDIFFGCYELTTIVNLATTPQFIGSDNFDHYDATLYVRASSLDAYKNADDWNQFRDIRPIGDNYYGTCGADGDNLVWNLTNDDVLTISGNGAMGDESLFMNYPFIQSVVIDEGVTSIGSFSYCPFLTSVSLPSSLTTICRGAFSGCSLLKSISLPNSVTTIGAYAFDF